VLSEKSVCNQYTGYPLNYVPAKEKKKMILDI